jgi:hypothetical protein
MLSRAVDREALGIDNPAAASFPDPEIIRP